MCATVYPFSLSLPLKRPSVHYDNRDLTVIPNYQPAANSQHLGDQLQLWGIAEGVSFSRYLQFRN